MTKLGARQAGSGRLGILLIALIVAALAASVSPAKYVWVRTVDDMLTDTERD